MNKIKNSAILILEDGAIFHGYQAGKKGTTTGELCFNTGMTGYQEVFTDPSYFGQVLLMTNDHIGNYGITKNEVESDAITIAGMVCRDFSEEYSRIKANQNVQEYFEENQSITKNLKVEGKKLLLLLPEVNKNVFLSSRNLQRAEVMTATAVNAYKVLNSEVLVITENSLKAIESILSK